MGNVKNSMGRQAGKLFGNMLGNAIANATGLDQSEHRTYHSAASEKRAEAAQTRADARANIDNARARSIRQGNLNAIDAAVIRNIDAVIEMEYSDSPQEIVRQISDLLVQVEVNSFKASTKEEKVRTKYSLAVLSKIRQGIQLLEHKDPNNPQLNYLTWHYLCAQWRKIFTFRSTWKDTAAENKDFSVFLIWGGMMSFCIIPLILLSVFEGFDKEEIIILIISIVVGLFLLKFIILGAALGIHKLKRNIISKRLLTEQQYYKSQESNVIPSAEPVVSKVEVPEPTKPSAPSYHIVDLNENDFLDEALRNIWKTYRSKGNKAIMSRKPMFASEAILGSVLYIGINPSFNPIDDKVMPQTNSSSALYYGSSYRDPMAPSYFKNLEYFADQCGLPYTQINLLYARENDRGLLLQSNPDFIREQLELTYKLIGMIKPKVILFFTSMCKDLIYGADRWVNPRSNRDGVYTLNGTNIPVIFCEDITTLDNIEQQKLVRQIKFL
ncbi:MAG: hypothetical protein MJ204_06915 [Bacteroidales bacterium]|nr:hypothetical protein [Bacteroidales bacterium]